MIEFQWSNKKTPLDFDNYFDQLRLLIVTSDKGKDFGSFDAI